MNLRDKKVLITGAASGIGRATALGAARAGAIVIPTDLNATALQTVAAEIAGVGRVGLVRGVDVSDFAAVQDYARAVHEAHGSVDVVMNIAGIAIWGEVQHLKHEQWKRVIDVNLMGPIHVIECFLPPMIEARRGGHLVNVSSAAGLFGLPWHAAYSASKFGLRGVSEVLRFDLRRYRIGVTLVCPGGVDTGLVSTIQVAGIDAKDPEFVALKGRFQRHAVTPERAARAILDGVVRERYMVFTSLDIRVGYWFQRKFAWPYEIVMRIANDYFRGVAKRHRARAAS